MSNKTETILTEVMTEVYLKMESGKIRWQTNKENGEKFTRAEVNAVLVAMNEIFNKLQIKPTHPIQYTGDMWDRMVKGVNAMAEELDIFGKKNA